MCVQHLCAALLQLPAADTVSQTLFSLVLFPALISLRGWDSVGESSHSPKTRQGNERGRESKERGFKNDKMRNTHSNLFISLPLCSFFGTPPHVFRLLPSN